MVQKFANFVLLVATKLMQEHHCAFHVKMFCRGLQVVRVQIAFLIVSAAKVRLCSQAVACHVVRDWIVWEVMAFPFRKQVTTLIKVFQFMYAGMFCSARMVLLALVLQIGLDWHAATVWMATDKVLLENAWRVYPQITPLFGFHYLLLLGC
jgi:hypothetical protein